MTAAGSPSLTSWLDRNSSARYVAPFAAFMILLVTAPYAFLSPAVEGPLRVVLLAVVCWVCWPRELPVRPVRPFMSIVIGAAVFVLWIAPDYLVPGYRNGPLFSNALVGHTHSSIPATALRSPWVLGWRSVRATLIVPIVEELFWRAWLMRWLIRTDFRSVPLGAYSPFAFWVTAVLFASEHGPYWDVGLMTGVIYNAWMIRSRSVADCILMHGITNGLLCGFVILTHQWQYWQ